MHRTRAVRKGLAIKQQRVGCALGPIKRRNGCVYIVLTYGSWILTTTSGDSSAGNTSNLSKLTQQSHTTADLRPHVTERCM
jgi:hypothetical protein